MNHECCQEVRLLLLELLAVDPPTQVNSELYPFLSAWAAQSGIQVQWTCCSYDPVATEFASLNSEALSALFESIQSLKPTHIFVNDRLDLEIVSRIRAECPTVELCYTTFGTKLRETTLKGLLSLPISEPAGAPRYLVDIVSPRYDCTLLEQRLPSPPWIQVIGGPWCSYDRPVTESRFYRDIDLSPCNGRLLGCSYCGLSDQDLEWDPAIDPLELAYRQIEIALESKSARHSRRFDVRSAAVLAQLDILLERLLEAEAPPCSLSFAVKADLALEGLARIETLISRIYKAGHTLHFPDMGIENFSPDERERLNKNVTENHVRLLLERTRKWEEEWPGVVLFRQYNGFSTILYTPWTTLDDLRLNLEAFKRLKHFDFNHVLITRLSILKERPISLLAQRDGLLREDFGDIAFKWSPASKVLKRYGTEVCWEFADHRVGAVFGLITRFFLAPDEHLDALGIEARKFLKSLPPLEQHPLEIFERLITVSSEVAEVSSAAVLLDLLTHKFSRHL